jgi:hypothetical protein
VAGGGGIAIADSSNPVLIRNTFARNTATLAGGGVFVTLNSFPSFQANILAENTGADGLEVDIDSGIAVFTCNDVWNNQPTNYVGFADPTGSNGNISLDPEFCDPGMADFGISTSSPCDSLLSPGGCGQVGSEVTACGTVAVTTRPGIPGLNLFPLVPNPSTRGTEIRFVMDSGHEVELGIFDARGRQIRTLLQGVDLLAGEHRVAWDGRDAAASRVAPGVYFIRLQAGNRSLAVSLVVQ